MPAFLLTFLTVALAMFAGREAVRVARLAQGGMAIGPLLAAIIGAAVLATQDLQGRPGLSWRTEHAAKLADKKAGQIGDDMSRSAKRAAKKTRKAAKKLGKKIEAITPS